jgi:hypothetical protein
MPAPPQWILNNFQISNQGGSGISESINPQTYLTPQSFILGGPGPYDSQALEKLNSYNRPQIEMLADAASPDFVASASGDFELTYYLEIDGPVGNVAIGVNAFGVATTAASSVGDGFAEADARASVQIDAFTSSPQTPNVIIADAYAMDGFPDTQSFRLSQTFEQETNSVFEVYMFAAADASSDGGSGFASTVVDPYFYVPSSDPNYQDYSILISPGIGNSPLPGVPEPSTWVMLLVGFAGQGLLILAGRGARAKAKPAIATPLIALPPHLVGRLIA